MKFMCQFMVVRLRFGVLKAGDGKIFFAPYMLPWIKLMFEGWICCLQRCGLCWLHSQVSGRHSSSHSFATWTTSFPTFCDQVLVGNKLPNGKRYGKGMRRAMDVPLRETGLGWSRYSMLLQFFLSAWVRIESHVIYPVKLLFTLI